MDFKRVTPRANSLTAFQLEFDVKSMEEAAVYLNTNFGDEFTYRVNERWIEKVSKDATVDQFIVGGDWIIMNFGRAWAMSAADFKKTYKMAR